MSINIAMILVYTIPKPSSVMVVSTVPKENKTKNPHAIFAKIKAAY
jgi:hypothetical protein